MSDKMFFESKSNEGSTKVEPKVKEEKMIKVETILPAFYNNRRVEVGTKMEVPEKMFSKVWMKKIESSGK